MNFFFDVIDDVILRLIYGLNLGSINSYICKNNVLKAICVIIF